jgi:hypothetical protein
MIKKSFKYDYIFMFWYQNKNIECKPFNNFQLNMIIYMNVDGEEEKIK